MKASDVKKRTATLAKCPQGSTKHHHKTSDCIHFLSH
jgi:hypothetical protein